jgi:hypothetical protein
MNNSTNLQVRQHATSFGAVHLITSLGDLRDVIRGADPAVNAAIFEQLGLKVTYLPGQDKLRAGVTISPEKFLEHVDEYGVMGSVRGPSASESQYVLSGELALPGRTGPAQRDPY